jgi:hypothetical protein
MTASLIGKLADNYLSDIDDERAEGIVRSVTAHRYGNVPGQLWERVSEGERLNADAMSWRVRKALSDAWSRLRAQQHAHWPPRSTDDPNQRVRMFGIYQHFASGIISKGRVIRQ